MRQFELRFLDKSGVVVLARGYTCADEFAALKEGERQAKTHAVEVWYGDRKLASINKDGAGAAHADCFGGQSGLLEEEHLSGAVSDHAGSNLGSRNGSIAAEITAVTRNWSVLAGLAPEKKARFLSKLRLLPRFPAGTVLDFTSDMPTSPQLVLSGWAMSYFVTADGERRILDFHLPGDLLEGVTFGRMKTVIQKVALVDLQLADFDETLLDSGAALESSRFIYARIRTHDFERQIMRIASLGCQGAKAKVASLFGDWYYRLERIGIARDGLFTAPVTQEIVSDALGISTVHVNRVIQDLRRDGLIRMNQREIEILDQERLAAIAGRN